MPAFYNPKVSARIDLAHLERLADDEERKYDEERRTDGATNANAGNEKKAKMSQAEKEKAILDQAFEKFKMIDTRSSGTEHNPLVEPIGRPMGRPMGGTHGSTHGWNAWVDP